jgi:hypothetical protein
VQAMVTPRHFPCRGALEQGARRQHPREMGARAPARMSVPMTDTRTL